MKKLLAAAMLLSALAAGSVGAKPVSGKALPPAPPPPPMSDEPLVCPTDVKQCPGGRFVSRNPANECAFDACPGANNN
jgi:hypothetical protein